MKYASSSIAILSSLAACLAAGCASSSAEARHAKEPGLQASQQGQATARHAVHFMEDDYPRALAEARAANKPLFVDAWATWCHTCVSMKAYVFPDPKLEAYADRFVWLSIDTEKPDNARFVETHPMKNWPTLWVIDPKDEKVALKWSNSATASELGSLLEDAELAMKGGAGAGEAGAALVRGNQATAEGKHDEAIAEYRAALAAAPREWPKRANAVEALLLRLSETKNDAACAETAANEVPGLAGGTSRATAALIGLECAERQPPSDGARATRRRLVDSIRAMAFDPREPVLADDRSGLFEGLVDALHEEKRDGEAREAAAAWASFLEGEASRATTSAARAVFDAHRLGAYISLGEPQRAVPMLEASERDSPNDYNPPARLGRAYVEMRRFDEALAAADRALARAYGPRKLRIFSLKGEILEKKGDPRGAASVLHAAVAESKTMALSGSYPKLVRDLEARAQRLEAASAK
jgi:tetratricopeptide (TPR) repeat protein